MSLSLDDLAQRVVSGERPALARALSLVERDAQSGAALVARLAQRLGRAHVVGITGPPGAGKSTLVGALVRQFLQMGQRVAVLAVDPSSPVTGGALLGDRFRIGECADDGRSFVRSTATRGALGGLTASARQMVQLMDAAGYDLVLVETVGTGQSEIDVARLADSLLVIFPPGLGDELQAIKAGILELADMLVVTKSDASGAAQASQSLRAAAPMWRKAPPIHSVSAMSGEGVAALAEAILARGPTLRHSPRRAGQEVLQPHPSMADAIDRLRAGLSARLPEALAAGLSVQALDIGFGAQSACLQVHFSSPSDNESFRFGAVAGAVMVLAAQMDLGCVVKEMNVTKGSMHLLLERGALGSNDQRKVGAGDTASEVPWRDTDVRRNCS